ncbi:MAG: PIN domain-containing protein [Deltaproteobacteria bacterium]|nr:PIN domain-containing protein [Deltaproteobacteria bacterium]
MRSLLLDTGPFVALLDKSENNHKKCVGFFKSFRGKILTTEPVLTETIYLLGPSVKAQKAAVEFILKGGAILVPQSTYGLSRASALMEKYGDVPMDFADATLVCLAEETGINEVFTLDIRGFSAYRFQEKKVFKILPEF